MGIMNKQIPDWEKECQINIPKSSIGFSNILSFKNRSLLNVPRDIAIKYFDVINNHMFILKITAKEFNNMSKSEQSKTLIKINNDTNVFLKISRNPLRKYSGVLGTDNNEILHTAVYSHFIEHCKGKKEERRKDKFIDIYDYLTIIINIEQHIMRNQAFITRNEVENQIPGL